MVIRTEADHPDGTGAQHSKRRLRHANLPY